MTKFDVKQLESKTRDELLTIIIGVANFNSKIAEFINLNYLMSADEKIKTITATYKKYRRSTRFYDYRATIEFCDNLTHDVLKPLQILAPQAPVEVAKLVQLMIDDFEKILDDKDDSSGCGMEYLYSLVKLWGLAWQYVPNKNYQELAQLLGNYLEHHGYISEFIFDDFKLALGKQGFEALEQALTNERYIFHVIGLQNNPDKYIAILHERKSYKDEYVLALAEMLIEDLRANEAIEWIEKYVTTNMKRDPFYGGSNRLYLRRQELLIRAYLDEGMADKANQELWNTFVETCNSKYYLQFIQNIAESQHSEYKQQALTIFMQRKTFIGLVWGFLADIQEFAELSQSILHNLDQIKQVDVAGLRKLTKELAVNGQYLAAVLIRRNLVENVLAEAKSRYYDYAVSDFKLATEYGDQVSNWCGHESNEIYLARLKDIHGKKYSFWNRISFL